MSQRMSFKKGHVKCDFPQEKGATYLRRFAEIPTTLRHLPATIPAVFSTTFFHYLVLSFLF